MRLTPVLLLMTIGCISPRNSSRDVLEWSATVIHGTRLDGYMVDGRQIDGGHFGVTDFAYAAYSVMSVHQAILTNKIVLVEFFANSVPTGGLPRDAVLVLVKPFFPFDTEGYMGALWPPGGDAYRGILPYDRKTLRRLAEEDLLPLIYATRESQWLPQQKAVDLVHARSPQADVRDAMRYPHGWLIKLNSTETVAGDMFIVGDDAQLKMVIRGIGRDQ